jgi:bifunctional ADP-heptose synthase (sugar kinase/adenylyltransferase)
VLLVGLVGGDVEVEPLLAELDASPGITPCLCRDSDWTTPRSRILQGPRGLRLRVDRPRDRSPAPAAMASLAESAYLAARKAHRVYLVDRGEGVLSPEVIAAATAGARFAGAGVKRIGVGRRRINSPAKAPEGSSEP